jgi:hypothetical protein
MTAKARGEERAMPDDQQVRNDIGLRDIRAVEFNWRIWYKRKLTIAERTAYFLGRIDGLLQEPRRMELLATARGESDAG